MQWIITCWISINSLKYGSLSNCTNQLYRSYYLCPAALTSDSSHAILSGSQTTRQPPETTDSAKLTAPKACPRTGGFGCVILTHKCRSSLKLPAVFQERNHTCSQSHLFIDFLIHSNALHSHRHQNYGCSFHIHFPDFKNLPAASGTAFLAPSESVPEGAAQPLIYQSHYCHSLRLSDSPKRAAAQTRPQLYLSV